MKLTLFLITALVAVVFAVAPTYAQEWQVLKVTFDSNTDTTWSLQAAAAADTSQPFRLWPDMSYQLIFNNGATTDSIDVVPTMECAIGSHANSTTGTAPTIGWTGTVAGVDSLAYYDTADSTANTPIVDLSTNTPAVWARLILKGGTGIRLSAAVTGQVYLVRYK